MQTTTTYPRSGVPRSSSATSRRCTAPWRTRLRAICTSPPAGRSPRSSATQLSCSTGCRYLERIAAAGLELQLVRGNPGYRFASERAQRTSDKYGAQSISLAIDALKAAG